MTAAMAIHQGGTVVTDDHKAARVLVDRGVRLRTTLDLVKAWADEQGIGKDVLRAALTDLRVIHLEITRSGVGGIRC